MITIKKYESYYNDSKMLRSHHPRLPLIAFYYEGDEWDQIRENARGTVFNTKTKELVSLPSEKVFYHTDYKNTTIGLDPSLYDAIVIKESGESAFSFFYDGKIYWKKDVPFSCKSVQKAWDEDYSFKVLEKDKDIFRTHTLSVILSSNTNKMILYSVRNIESGKELSFSDCSEVAEELGFIMPGTIETSSFDKVVELAGADFLRDRVIGYYPTGERVKIDATKPKQRKSKKEKWILSWVDGKEVEQTLSLVKTQERADAIAFFAELDEYSFNVLEGVREDYAERISKFSGPVDKISAIVSSYSSNYIPIAMNLLNEKQNMELVVRKAVYRDYLSTSFLDNER